MSASQHHETNNGCIAFLLCIDTLKQIYKHTCTRSHVYNIKNIYILKSISTKCKTYILNKH